MRCRFQDTKAPSWLQCTLEFQRFQCTAECTLVVLMYIELYQWFQCTAQCTLVIPMYTVTGMWGSSCHDHKPLTRKLWKLCLHETRDPEVLELEKRPRVSLLTSLGQDTKRSLNLLRVWSPKNALHMMREFQTHKIHRAQPSNRDYLKSL